MTTSARDRLKARTAARKATVKPPAEKKVVKPVAAQSKKAKRPRHHAGCNCKECNDYRTQAGSETAQPTTNDDGAQRQRGKGGVPGESSGDKDGAQRTDPKPKASKGITHAETSHVDEHANDDRDAVVESNGDHKAKPNAGSGVRGSGVSGKTKRSDTGNAGARQGNSTSTRKKGSVKNPPAPKLPIAEGILKPGIIFEGKVAVYSTCRDCGELMQVIYATEYVHPCCTPKPTHVESLAQGWLTCVTAGDDESAALTEAEIEKIDGAPPDLKAAALQYVSWGWPVFPLQPNSKEPATAHGFEDATTKPNWVEKWWNRNPRYNIGLATGHRFDVLDVDPDAGGVPSFSALLEAKRIPPTHSVVVTASGGVHMYVMPTGKGNRAKWMPGLDFRGRGGYVVAPPSTLGERGRSWSWLCVPSPKLMEEEF